MNHHVSKQIAIAILFAVVQLVACSQSQATEPLQADLKKIAVRLNHILDSENQAAVQMGFILPENGAKKDASYGRRISVSLEEELTRLGKNVSPDAFLIVSGVFNINHDNHKLEISFKVKDRNGKEIDNAKALLKDEPVKLKAKILTTQVVDTTELMLASNLSLPANRDETPESIVEKIEKIEENNTNPLTVSADGYLVMDEIGLAIRLQEISPEFSRDDRRFYGETVAPINATGPHFSLQEDRSYAIELKNLSKDIDFACKVLFDGVDTFALRDRDQREYENAKWVVYRGENARVLGWFKNTNRVSAFQIVPDEESVAYKLEAPLGIGSIQIVVTAAWPKGQGGAVANKFRPTMRARGGGGQGQPIGVNFRRVAMETGIVLGTLSAEYDTH